MTTTATDTQGVVLECPQCGQKNRLAYSRLGAPAQCGSCKAAIASPSTPLEVDQLSELSTLLSTADLPVLVDFWAPWCPPCRMVAPEIAKVAEKSAGKWLVVKVNSDVDPAVGSRFNVRSIPTMALFQGGREVGRTMGARPAAAIETFVQETLARPL
jgi:thioredoxin 2